MLNLALFLLSLILFHVDVGWSQNTLPAKSRGQLTKELHDLTIKFDQHLKTDTSAEDIQKMGQVLGETMTAAITSLGDKLGEQLGEALGEQLGEALGDKLTEAIEKLGDKQVDGIQNLEHTLGEKLSDLTQKCQNSVDVPASCVDVMEYDTSNSVHTLIVSNTQMEVFCDQTTAGGGWAVIQRRVDGQVDFYRNWTDYERGFGDLTHEFWLGLDKIHRLTSSNNYSLRVDLEDFDGSTAYAEYRDFSISGSDDFYRLHVGEYSGTAGNSISTTIFNQNNQQFTTWDQDHDPRPDNCARDHYHGAWWYGVCGYANLNGEYKADGAGGLTGITWYYWKNDWRSYKHVEMKVKPWS